MCYAFEEHAQCFNHGLIARRVARSIGEEQEDAEETLRDACRDCCQLFSSTGRRTSRPERPVASHFPSLLSWPLSATPG